MYGSDRGYGGPRRSFDGPRRSFAPVNVGDELDVKIEAVGEKGDGVAKVKGFVLFVPGVKTGDEVHIKVTRVLKKVGFAEVVGGAQKSEQPAEESSEESYDEESSEESSEEESTEEPAEDSEDFGEEEGQ
jgi:predicted RNA-binding protein with TRAM domain